MPRVRRFAALNGGLAPLMLAAALGLGSVASPAAAADKVVKDDKHHLAAMGFLTVGRRFLNNQPDIIDDRIDVTFRTFQGLTITCARCHDHKYDPIPQTDYYALGGVFLNTVYHEYPRVPKTVVDQYTKVEEQIEQKQKMLQTMQTKTNPDLRLAS